LGVTAILGFALKYLKAGYAFSFSFSFSLISVSVWAAPTKTSELPLKLFIKETCNVGADIRPEKDPDAIRTRHRSKKQREVIQKRIKRKKNTCFCCHSGWTKSL
jgi:hypothetical protein